jgi:hypothetical protein
LDIHYKQAWSYIHSPDPNYEAKLQDVDIRIAQAKRGPDSYVVLFQDELTYYRQAYEEAGKIQPLARRSHESNTKRRIAVTLDS